MSGSSLKEEQKDVSEEDLRKMVEQTVSKKLKESEKLLRKFVEEKTKLKRKMGDLSNEQKRMKLIVDMYEKAMRNTRHQLKSYEHKFIQVETDEIDEPQADIDEPEEDIEESKSIIVKATEKPVNGFKCDSPPTVELD